MRRAGLVLCLWLLAVPAASAHRVPWPNLTLPGTPTLWAELGGWHASRVERVRLLRDLILLYQSVPSFYNSSDRQALESAILLFDSVERQLAAISKDHSITLNWSTRADRQAIQKLLDLLGYEITEQNAQTSVRARKSDAHEARRTLLIRAGFSIDEFIDQLQKKEPAKLVWPTFTVPLPVGFDFWVKAVGVRALSETSLALELIRSRRAGLLFVGMMGLDPNSLKSLSSDNRFVAILGDDRVGVFANFSRSIRIIDSRIATPGGAASVDLWQKLVGASVDDPISFIERLLNTDRGRLAWFFDFVQQAPPKTQLFALSAWESDMRRRVARVEAFYETFWVVTEAERFDFRVQRLGRPIFDPTIVTSLLPLSSEGRVEGPSSKRFWREVFETSDLPARVNAPPAAASSEDVLDAAAVINTVIDSESLEGWRLSGARASAMMFALAFALRDPQAPPSSIATIARSALRYPALVRSLDRMGVSLETSVSLVDQARRVSVLGREDFHLAVGQFQAALGLVERCVLIGSITSDESEALLKSLATVQLTSDRRFRGGIVRWVAESLVPIARAKVDLDAEDGVSTTDRTLIALLAGRLRGRMVPTVDFDGWKYRVDPSTSRFSVAERVRARQSAISLDLTLETLDLAEAIATVDGPDAASLMATALRSVAQQLKSLEPETAFVEPFSVAQVIGESADRLGRIRSARDARRAVDVQQDVLLVLDRVGLAVTRSLLYVSYLGDPNSPLLLGGDISLRHDFGTAEARQRDREIVAWTLPETRSEAGETWHVRGAMVALDFGLASLVLRESLEGVPTNPGKLDTKDQEGLIRTAVTLPVNQQWSVQSGLVLRQRLTDARRALAAGSRPRPDPWEWRFAGYDWSLTNEPEAAASMLSLADLLELSPLPDISLDAFGPQLEPLSGSLRAGVSPRIVRAGIVGHLGRGYFAASTMDLKIRIAELMSELDLPVVLAPILTARVTARILAQVGLGAPFDWLVVLRRIGDVSSAELTGILSTLTADGTMVAVNQ